MSPEELRLECLQAAMACIEPEWRPGITPENVVARAEVYFTFVSGMAASNARSQHLGDQTTGGASKHSDQSPLGDVFGPVERRHDGVAQPFFTATGVGLERRLRVRAEGGAVCIDGAASLETDDALYVARLIIARTVAARTDKPRLTKEVHPCREAP